MRWVHEDDAILARRAIPGLIAKKVTIVGLILVFIYLLDYSYQQFFLEAQADSSHRQTRGMILKE